MTDLTLSVNHGALGLGTYHNFSNRSLTIKTDKINELNKPISLSILGSLRPEN